MRQLAVIDFETTGLRPGTDRIIEVAAAIVEDGVIVATFAELMDPGFRIPSFITGLTGISDEMVRDKPRPERVMPRLRSFLGDHVCVAHNASFDKRFFAAEMGMAGEGHDRTFLCTLLLARRVLQRLPNHQLTTLVRHFQIVIPPGMKAHRALADVLMTCQLWRRLCDMLHERLNCTALDLNTIMAVLKKSKNSVDHFIKVAACGHRPTQPSNQSAHSVEIRK